MSELLESLAPNTQEELSLLRTLVDLAQSLQARAQRDLGFVWTSACRTEFGFGLADLFNSLSEESRRYFYGLVEAVEIYQSIHGTSLVPHSLTLADTSVLELRQIRDICLLEGLRSVF